ncbi:MAG: ATP-binding cassette domain-containing protein [Synergistaceae bacterium]|jgi:oligopeptide/dipeptide ABC transporter ATP-binding protein|nr:ATP-binding cassette domain-containing protein [Synergistaceae bacterium]
MSEKDVPLVETIDLRKLFKLKDGARLHAVDGVSVRIAQGRTLGVVGESGCGKSTIGRLILRLIEPTSGRVMFNGQDISKFGRRQMHEMRRDMQIIFQDPYSSIDPRMSVIEIIAEYIFIHRMFKNKTETFNRAAKLMDMVGLARRYANSYPHELDGGRRQRIGIARALSLGPKFIVCDEPVSALDVSIQAQILNLLMDLQEEFNLTYMFVTHDLSVVKHISSEIMVMYLGKCVESADSGDLFENPRHPYTNALLESIPEPDLSRRNKEMKTIKGEVTSPINVKPGCRFAARCDFCMEICKNQDPELMETSEDHRVACFKVNGITPNI